MGALRIGRRKTCERCFDELRMTEWGPTRTCEGGAERASQRRGYTTDRPRLTSAATAANGSGPTVHHAPDFPLGRADAIPESDRQRRLKPAATPEADRVLRARLQWGRRRDTPRRTRASRPTIWSSMVGRATAAATMGRARLHRVPRIFRSGERTLHRSCWAGGGRCTAERRLRIRLVSRRVGALQRRQGI